jgi:hypothetical protein
MSERLCLDCGADLAGKRADAQFCDGTCKKRWQRKQPKHDKPKSKSHVVLLKERTKERILGKAEGHSSTPKTELPQGTDVPPAGFHKLPHVVPPEGAQLFPETKASDWEPYVIIDPAFEHGGNVSVPNPTSVKYEDATAGLPPEALPEVEIPPHTSFYDPIGKMAEPNGGWVSIDKNTDSWETKKGAIVRFDGEKGTIQHHGTENDLAKSVISKVPVQKLDPNSPEAELARLEKSQLRNTKKKES